MDVKQEKQEHEYDFPYHYIPSFNDGFTQTFTWSWGKNYLSAIEFILKQIRSESENISSLIDVGCGDGRLTKELTLEFPSKNIVGIDYSEKAINLARALNPNIVFYNDDINNDFSQQTFDALTLVEVFEHIPLDQCDGFVKALAKNLSNNGLVFLTVPHKNKSMPKKHFQHFDFDSIKSYFDDDFVIEDVEFFERQTGWSKIINVLSANELYILNNRTLNNLIYSLYKNKWFFTDEKHCGRIYLKLRKRQ